MAKLLELEAYIANSNTHENVMHIGKWVFGVCVNTGFNIPSSGGEPSDYNYLTSRVDEPTFLGGDLPIAEGGDSQKKAVDELKRYIPLLNGITIFYGYITNNYELKLVNSVGDFAVTGLTRVSGAFMYNIYKGETNQFIGSIVLSGNAFNTDNNNIRWVGLLVSNFSESGNFAYDSEYFALEMQGSENISWDIYKVSLSSRAIDFLNNIKSYEPPSSDPYNPGGTTEPGGGDGDFDNTSTPIPIPELPTLSAIDTGFISLFNPNLAQLQELANYMWSDLFDINGWKKIFADPMDAILGLSIVPVAVPEGGTRPVTVGNISTGVNLTVASTQYVEVDCGTINLNEYWGSYLDYDPYTRAEIYLPYVGTHPLAIDDIMKKTIHVTYHVDILSGACCAYVQCGESVLYSFVGQCSCSVPITGNDWTNVINGALSIAASIGTMVATGGATAPMVAGSIASAAVNSLKPNVEKSGSMGGMGGMLGVQTPYLILTRPRQALPADQNVYMGYPSFITTLLGECSGYTEVESIHLENVPATGEELTEIENLLKEGVIM